jgi:hypothetical protein
VAVLSLDRRRLADVRAPIAISAPIQRQLAAPLFNEEKCCGSAIVPYPKCTAPVRLRSSRRLIYSDKHISTQIGQGPARSWTASVPRAVRGIFTSDLQVSSLSRCYITLARLCPGTSVRCSCLPVAPRDRKLGEGESRTRFACPPYQLFCVDGAESVAIAHLGKPVPGVERAHRCRGG